MAAVGPLRWRVRAKAGGSLLRRGRRWTLAAVALGVALMQVAACDGTSSGPDHGSGVDPVLLDYVAPVDGDAWEAARVHFDVGIAQLQARKMARCLRESGYPGAESAFVEGARLDATNIGSPLPALSQVAKYGVTRGEPAEVLEVRDVVASSCKERGSAEAVAWLKEAGDLRREFMKSIHAAIAETEAEPVWDDATSCMRRAGAPDPETDAPDGQKYTSSGPDLYLFWLTTFEIDAHFAQHRPDGGGPESRSYAKCMKPFFKEVRRSLQGDRSAFVERHFDELIRIDRTFEQLDVPGE